MKKLLSLLSTITIASGGIVGTVGNAPISAKKEINYSQTNNLESLNRIKRTIEEIMKIIWTDDWHISALAVDKHNNVYFGSNKNVYVLKNGTTTPVKINGYTSNTSDLFVGKASTEINTIIVDNNNNVYFGTNNNCLWVLKANETEMKIIWTDDWHISALAVDKHNNVYFGSNKNVYVLKNGTTTPVKINGYTSNTSDLFVGKASTEINTIIVDNNNNVYFGANNNCLWVLKANETEMKIIWTDDWHISALAVDKHNNVYFGSNKNVYVLKNGTTTPVKINGYTSNTSDLFVGKASTEINTIIVDNNNNVYFGTNNNCLWVLKANETEMKIIWTDDWHISALAVDKHNNVYFGSNKNVYVLKKGTTTPVKINGYTSNTSDLFVGKASTEINTIIVDNNNNVYFGTNNNCLWVLKNKKINLENFIKVTNFQYIENDSDKYILNELNYLNYYLDISHLEIANKTNTSAIIKAKNNSNKYFGEKKIYYTINNQQNKIINLNELIKKGIFLSFRDENTWTVIKEIKNINTNNLIYSNVTATKNIEPTYTKNSKSICFGTTTLFHNLPEKQNMKTSSCKYTKETTINSQITTGLSKTNSEEKRIEQTSTSSMEDNWNIELSTSGGIWPFAEVSATAGVGGNYVYSNTNMSSETKTLSNKFDFSNSKTNEYKEISEVELPSQEIEVNPNQKIKVTASLDEVLAQVTLKLTQNIHGEITSQITNTSNEEKSFKISIKEIMQKLKQYNLLSQEITINNDDSITFNGNANRSLKQGFDSNIEFREVK